MSDKNSGLFFSEGKLGKVKIEIQVLANNGYRVFVSQLNEYRITKVKWIAHPNGTLVDYKGTDYWLYLNKMLNKVKGLLNENVITEKTYKDIINSDYVIRTYQAV